MKISACVFIGSLLLSFLSMDAQSVRPVSLVDQKTKAEIKKFKAERLKAFGDFVTNKTLIAAIGVALLVGGPVSTQLVKYIATKYGKAISQSKELEKFFSRCYSAQLSRNENITFEQAMGACDDPLLKLADIVKLEDALNKKIEERKLMGPVDAYWGLSIKDKGKHIVYKIANNGIEAVAKLGTPLVTFSWVSKLHALMKKPK